MIHVFRIMALAVAVVSILCGQALAQTLYSHTFNTLGGWPDSDATNDLNAVYSVVGNEYVINPLQNNTYALVIAPVALNTQDVVVESTIRLAASNPESRAGIACRVSPGLTFYYFGLIAKGGFEIVKVQGGRGTVLTSGAFPVGTLDNVKVRAECSGNTLILYANGRELGRATDNSLPPGVNAGLVSVSPVIAATNAAFADFSIARAGQAAAGTPQPPAIATTAASPPPAGAGGGGGAGLANLPHIDEIAMYNDADGKPGAKQSLFSVGQSRIYVVLKMSGNTKAKFTAKWIAIRGAQETPLLEGQHDNASGHNRVWLYANRNWNAGHYRVDVYADGQLLEKVEFSVY